MTKREGHVPVMLEACLQALALRPEGVYVDATLGGAGHAEAIARTLTTGTLLGIDRDADALVRAKLRLAPYGERVRLAHSDFRDLAGCMDEAGLAFADGILFDLGISSFQVDEADRGFSYMQDAPLDMRMDRSQGMTAAELINTADEDTLRHILYTYGEERYAPRIAAAVVRARQKAPVETTGQLARLIADAMPAAARREKQHPAKRSFQGLRVFINDELNAVEFALRAAISRLAPGGRVAVLSFHSLEDRIVKQIFAEAAHPCVCPPDFPVCVCGRTPQVRVIGPKPALPDEREVSENPRARSAKLRTAQKL